MKKISLYRVIIEYKLLFYQVLQIVIKNMNCMQDERR